MHINVYLTIHKCPTWGCIFGRILFVMCEFNFFTAADEGARAVPFDNGSSPFDPFFSPSCLKGL